VKWENLRHSSNVIDRRTKAKNIGIIATIIAAISGLFVYGPKLPTYITDHIIDTNNVKSVDYNFDESREFIEVLLGITEDKWNQIFSSRNLHWISPKLILFTDKTKSACGDADFEVGPFYCSGDKTVYIDLDFFKLINNNLKIVGDTSQAYVVFHEVGHHVQTLFGILPKVQNKMKISSEKDANLLSVRLELQADCYAGIIFNKSSTILEPGDIAEFINAAARIGDDWLQSRSGTIIPDSFTHGTSEQRAGWLLHGYKHGTIEDCNTFSQPDSIIKI